MRGVRVPSMFLKNYFSGKNSASMYEDNKMTKRKIKNEGTTQWSVVLSSCQQGMDTKMEAIKVSVWADRFTASFFCT